MNLVHMDARAVRWPRTGSADTRPALHPWLRAVPRRRLHKAELHARPASSGRRRRRPGLPTASPWPQAACSPASSPRAASRRPVAPSCLPPALWPRGACRRPAAPRCLLPAPWPRTACNRSVAPSSLPPAGPMLRPPWWSSNKSDRREHGSEHCTYGSSQDAPGSGERRERSMGS